MKKILSVILASVLAAGVFTGCSSNIGKASSSQPAPGNTADSPAPAGALKTGFAIVSSVKDSTSAGEKDGMAKTDTTAAAVTVDGDGRIVSCFIDAVQTSIQFSGEGKVLTDLATTPKAKNELGEEYGLKKASSIGKEWNEQAAAFAQYATGKTVAELKGIALTEGAPAKDSELAASVTIHVGDFINVIEKAVSNAKELGAQPGDKLGLGIATNVAKSTDAGADPGLAQAYSMYGAVTFAADGKITSCYLDGSQSNVNFDAKGQITSDINAAQMSKDELGDQYGMKKASSIGKEWNEQAAAYASYVTGKTLDEVKGIALTEGAPAKGSELAASVTVHVGDFNAVIEKAAQNAK